MYLGEYIVMHILIIFILLAAKSAVSECHYVGVPERTNRTTDDVAVGTVVEYSCLVPGETFSNGKTVYKIRCLESGEWSALPDPCLRT